MLERSNIYQKRKTSGIKVLRQRKVEINRSESYGKFIFMSNNFEKDVECPSVQDLNIFSSLLGKKINEIQLDIALGFIENIGIMNEFNQFRVENKHLNLWQAIDEYSNLYAYKISRECKSSREHFSLD